MFDVAALGEAMVEFNQTVAGQPEYLQGFGGDTSNAAIAAARAGARTAYLTRIGTDNSGQALLDLWEREGVDTSAIERTADAHTGIYFVTHGKGGHEFSYMRAGSAASRMAPQVCRAWRRRSSSTIQVPLRRQRCANARRTTTFRPKLPEAPPGALFAACAPGRAATARRPGTWDRGSRRSMRGSVHNGRCRRSPGRPVVAGR